MVPHFLTKNASVKSENGMREQLLCLEQKSISKCSSTNGELQTENIQFQTLKRHGTFPNISAKLSTCLIACVLSVLSQWSQKESNFFLPLTGLCLYTFCLIV